MKYGVLIVFFYSVLLLKLNAQTFEFESGFYINNSGDTIQGFILNDELKRVSKGIHFQSSKNSGIDFIQAQNVLKASIPKFDFFLEKEYDSLIYEYRLAKIISNGEIKFKSYYGDSLLVYLFEKDTLRYVFRKSKYIEEGTRIATYNRLKYPVNDSRIVKKRNNYHKGVLSYLTKDYPELIVKIEISKSRIGNLSRIVDQYNSHLDQDFEKYNVSRKKYSLSFFIGLNQNQNIYRFNSRYAFNTSDYEFGSTLGGIIGIRIQRYTNFTIGFNYFNHRGSFQDFGKGSSSNFYDAKINFEFMEVPIGLLQYLINKDFGFAFWFNAVPGILISNNFTEYSYISNQTNDVDFPLSPIKFGIKGGPYFEFSAFFIRPGIFYGLGRDGVNGVLTYKGLEVSIGYKLDLN